MKHSARSAFVSLIVPFLSFGQSTPGTTAPAPAARGAGSHRVTLDVVVTDKSDKPVSGLQQRDFTIVDNKQPQPIVSFQAVAGTSAELPVEIVLLIDEVNASFQTVANVRQQTLKFLRQNGGQLAQPVTLIFFSDAGTKILSQTRDGNALAAAMDQNENALRTSRPSQGVYGEADRLQLSIRALNSVVTYEDNKPGKKMLLWISPGWAFLSGPNANLSAKDRQQIFDVIVGASTALLESRITLYSIDPLGAVEAGGSRTSYYREFLKGVSTPKQAQEGNLSLQVLAYQSGGRVLNSSNDITSLIASSVADANSWYVLSFDAPPADGPNEYHALDIRIGKPGLKARMRTGYYNQP
jgi:VWFA-related protein